MESKIFIDINYASRDPQIVIHSKESDDPRDKLVSMLTGHSMPGVRDGYCRIERYPGTAKEGVEIAVITPVHPVDLIKHIPQIAELAESNKAHDTSEVPGILRRVIKSEYERLLIGGVEPERADPIVDPELTYEAALEMVDHVCVEKLPPDVYKKWKDIMFYPQKSSQR